MREKFTVTLYRSDTSGNPKNCIYPQKIQVENEEQLREAIRTDHVFVKFRDNHRSNLNFEYADLLVLDCDNDHSDVREDWIWPDDLADLLPEVAYAIYSSRNDNAPKEGRSPRPRFHVIFPIDRVTDAEEYATLKRQTVRLLPFFDHNALDAGRFFFGTNANTVEFHPGCLNLTQYLAVQDEPFPVEEKLLPGENSLNPEKGPIIPEGERNTRLSKFAGKLLKRLGDSVETKQKFLETASRCSPPLPEDELEQIWHSAQKFYHKISSMPGYISPEEYGLIKSQDWEEPISLESVDLPEFPVDALPKPIAAFVLEVSEMLQVYPDMPAFCALGVLSLCFQKKFAVRVNEDWLEPINLYLLVVADPSERKSPCLKEMTAPVRDFEEVWNRDHEAEIELSHEVKSACSAKRELARKNLAKGKGTEEELAAAVNEDLEFIPKEKIRLFLDDVTPEKLTAQMASNGGVCSIMSAEGGVFRNFAGGYSGSTNCDTLLKAYSADPIRVDRMTRTGETISSPALTLLIMMQPKVLSSLMSNEDFLGRGLNARILYSIPKSLIGSRNINPKTVSPEVRKVYEDLICSLLEMEICQTEEIYLSPEAEQERQTFALDVERKLLEDYAGFRDWAGKIVGTTMRIAALLCLAESGPNGRIVSEEHWERFPYYEITGQQMRNAIRIARYAIEHAKAAYNNMGHDPMTILCRRVLAAIRRNALKEFNVRDIMRKCSFLKTGDDVQKVLDHMSDLGFFTIKDPEEHRKPGRPNNPTYISNPLIFQEKIIGAA